MTRPPLYQWMGTQRRHYPPEINQQILALQSQGLSHQEISGALQVPLYRIEDYGSMKWVRPRR